MNRRRKQKRQQASLSSSSLLFQNRHVNPDHVNEEDEEEELVSSRFFLFSNKKKPPHLLTTTKRPQRRRQQLAPPQYRVVGRSESALLTACWNQDWSTVLHRCRLQLQPNGGGGGRGLLGGIILGRRQRAGGRGGGEAFCKSSSNGRTALHLATMPGVRCPVDVLQALLECNPHAVLVEDHHRYGGTPLHFLCGSHKRDHPAIVRAFVNAALEAQDLYYPPSATPLRVYGWSPLYLAARRKAVPETLHILLQTRRRRGGGGGNTAGTRWIAPFTGGETFVHDLDKITFECFCSPLAALWDVVKTYFFQQQQQQGEEEDEEIEELSCDERVVLSSSTRQTMLEMAQLLLDTNTNSQQQENDEDDNDSYDYNEEDEDDGDIPIQQLLVLAGEDDQVLTSWLQILLLLHEHVMTFQNFVFTVATLYRPIPGLLDVMCHVFPSHVQKGCCAADTTTTTTGWLPIHAVLRRDSILELYRKDGYTEKLTRILMQHNADTLLVPDPSTQFYPAILGAAEDVALDVIFDMLLTCPLVLDAQQHRQKL